MSTKTEVMGKWNQLKGQVRERWGEITDHDFSRVQGNTEQLIGMIEEKTGTTRRDVEAFINKTMQSGESMVESASETVRDYANRASDAVKDQYGKVNRQLEAGVEDAQELIRTRPGMSVGVAFGVGILAGALVSALLCADRR